MTMNTHTIRGAMAAEEMLARGEDELDSTLDLLPDDSPLKIAALQSKAALGDLEGLPANHPLRLAMEDARQNWESAQEMEVPEEADPVDVRRAKKVDAGRARTAERRREEDEGQRLRTAADMLNGSLVETMDSVKRLRQNLVAAQEDLENDKYATMKLARLERMLLATERGLIESKINPGRLTNA